MFTRPYTDSATRREETLARRQDPELAAKPVQACGRYGGGRFGPQPKPVPHRDQALMDMARGRRCLMTAVDACEGLRGETTVTAHRNEGKGMGTKQSDAYSCWACAMCHFWYDQGSAPRAEKRRAFLSAHLRQVLEWRRIVSDPTEPARFRRAAQFALDWLDATPIGGLE